MNRDYKPCPCGCPWIPFMPGQHIGGCPYAPQASPFASARVVSAPDAAIKVTEYEPTDATRVRLQVPFKAWPPCK